jgi:hypothetical protein
MKHLYLPSPIYFIGENAGPDFAENILLGRHTADEWTAMVRKGVEQIDDDYIMILLEDLFFKKDMHGVVSDMLYYLELVGGDSIRVLNRTTRSRTKGTGFYIHDREVERVQKGAMYRVSFSPNIYRKEFLLRVLDRVESCWQCELDSHERITEDRKIYHYYYPDCYDNVMVQGRFIKGYEWLA